MLLYRLLSRAALALYSPYALLRSLAGRRRLGNIAGRLARGDLPDLEGGIWIHAVSVGEVGVARSLLPVLSRRAPGRRIGLSVTTAAGYHVAEKAREQGAAVFWFPLELVGPIRRTLTAVRPGLILLTETELWPLFLESAAARGIPVALVNGRISEKSFRRYARLGSWFEGVLRKVSLFAMQSEADADRIRRLGAAPEHVRVTGNVKYDVPPAPAFPDSLRIRSAALDRPIIVAASTGEGEEAAVLEAWRPIARRSLLAIAPRRPERFEEAARLIEFSGYALLRRSSADPPFSDLRSGPESRTPAVYLLDSMGELASLYGEAALAFVGGSLAPVGGHNPIEAWAEGVPVVVGPHTRNFHEIMQLGEETGILTRVRDARELSLELSRWIDDPTGLGARGERARRFAAENRGAAAATVDLVLPLLDRETPARAAAP